MTEWRDPHALLLLLAMTLAGPVIGHIRPRRNAVAYLAGDSTIGKTTIGMFATGLYGDPTRPPLKMEAFRTTAAGFFQSVQSLGGLPMLIDECHTHPHPDHLEGWIYQFANGQRYTVGTKTQHAAGGEELFGTLLCIGEDRPVFRNAGSNRRILWIDGAQYLPLGADAGPNTTLGRDRATMLEQAWLAGAGSFGHRFCETVWSDWRTFLGDVEAYHHAPALQHNAAWSHLLAIAAASLSTMLDILDLDVTVPVLDTWNAMLNQGQADADPAIRAYEGIITMLVQSRDNDGFAGYVAPEGWEERWLDGKLVACKREHDTAWRVLVGTQQFKRYTESANAVRQYGGRWLQEGWITPFPSGALTAAVRTGNQWVVRAILVPDSAIVTEFE